jgi:hypothetical protein
MESIVDIVFNAENIRMLVLLAFGFCGYVMLKTSLEKKIDCLDRKIDGVDTSLNHKIDCLESSLLKAMDEKIAVANQSLYAQLKANDFKHLNDTIEALTFILEKNKFLAIEDKEYIDGRLDK